MNNLGKVFGQYSQYYDVLYNDKDYKGETEFVHQLIQKYRAESINILDLGCGTGKHDTLLVKNGYSIDGVDMSRQMLMVANKNRMKINDKEQRNRLNYFHSDIGEFQSSKMYNIVISLFHVVSYQQTNNDLFKALSTAYNHLDSGGIFIFDFWYGPAVLTDRPQVRVKKIENESFHLFRITTPKLYPNKNCVDLDFQIFVKDKLKDEIFEFSEVHRMRYFFKPELEVALSNIGFKILEFGEWMTGNIPNDSTWGVYCICEK